MQSNKNVYTQNQNYTAMGIANAFRTPYQFGPFQFAPVSRTDIFDPNSGVIEEPFFEIFSNSLNPSDPSAIVEVYYSVLYNFTDQYKKTVFSNDQAAQQAINLISDNLDAITNFLSRPPEANTESQQTNLFNGIMALSSDDFYFYSYVDAAPPTSDSSTENYYYSSATCDCDYYINAKYYCTNTSLCTCDLLQKEYDMSCSTGSPNYCNCPSPDTCEQSDSYGETCTSYINQGATCSDGSGKVFPCTCSILSLSLDNFCEGCACDNTTIPENFDTCYHGIYDDVGSYTTCTSMQYGNGDTPLMSCSDLYDLGYDCSGCQTCQSSDEPTLPIAHTSGYRKPTSQTTRQPTQEPTAEPSSRRRLEKTRAQIVALSAARVKVQTRLILFA